MRRASAVVALVLAVLALLGPIVLDFADLRAWNLDALQLGTIVSYWTLGSALLVGPLIALTTLPGEWFERWTKNTTDAVMSLSKRQFAVGLFLLALALAVGFSWYCFQFRPTTADEIAQLFHARILLSGRLSLPPDPNPEFFAIDNVIDRPRWMSQFPIGGPAILAPGVALGVPWLVSPVFTALTALNVYRFAQVAYTEGEARAAALLFVASPMVLVMGGSQMNHTATACFITLALASLARWARAGVAKDQRVQAAIIGAAIGAAATIRPLDGVIGAAVVGLAMLWIGWRRGPLLKSVLFTLLAGAVPVALLLLANARMTGRPLLFGYELLWGPNIAWGLHDDPLGVPHDATRAVFLGLRYVTLLNWSLTAWPVPVLLVIAFGYSVSRVTRGWDLLLTGFFAVQLVAYAMYWHDGRFAGPRFLFSVAPALLIVTARAGFMLTEVARGEAWRAAVALMPVCVFVSWVRPMPPYGVRGITGEYREVRQSLKRRPPSKEIVDQLPTSLVFVQEGASARLVRRLWGIGVSRQDAARLVQGSDVCTLLDAVRAEEARAPDDSAGRLTRIEQTTRILPAVPQLVAVLGEDPGFRSIVGTTVSAECVAEAEFDKRVAQPYSYGPLLLENRFDAAGKLTGQVIYAMNLGPRNELLRARFGDRQWLRLEFTRGGAPGSGATIVPYDAPAGLAAPTPGPVTKKAP